MQDRRIRPKEYTHIDYEALLIYMMKNGVSLEQALIDNGLTIARSTVIRNINKILETDENNLIIRLYKKYVIKMQKELPETLIQQINELPNRKIINKLPLESLYKKLSIMKSVLEECNGIFTEAAIKICSGTTELGKVNITSQGLKNNMKRYEEVEKAYREEQKEMKQKNKMLERE